MFYLVAVTLLWAFSFSLIGVYLAGQVDVYCAVLVRISLGLIVFLPYWRPRAGGLRSALSLMGVGALQIGLMYLFFYQSFLWLSVPEVLLFTIVTPLYIALADNLLARRIAPRVLAGALLAVAGAALIRYTAVSPHFWRGFMMVQGANLCFALGQVAYRRLVPHRIDGLPGRARFAWFFLGAWPVAAAAFLLLGDPAHLPTTATQWCVLAWLGLAASGAGYYFWNEGALRVDAGTLAVMNNVLIPAGLIVNVLIWNHNADLSRLALGALVIGAALIVGRDPDRRRAARPIGLVPGRARH